MNKEFSALEPLSDEELQGKTEEFKNRYKEGEDLDSLLPEAFACVKETCRRLCGKEVDVSGYRQKWDMVPYDVQILGAIAMHKGAIAEMQTGEGKTLTAAMPLYLNALTGKPVHLVTVNDYLARRDCDWMEPIFSFLGIQSGALTSGIPLEERRTFYQYDVLYGTASEFGFDYLRDNSMALSKEEQVQRGYYFAIIDEIDSILIDEARTPLIISGPAPQSKQMYGELQQGTAAIVKKQQALCNRLANEGREALQSLESFTDEKTFVEPKGKEKQASFEVAMKKLWTVSKGVPNHRTLKRLRENPDFRDQLDRLDVYFHSEQNKEARAKLLAELYIIVDEKASEYELTDKGIGLWQETVGGSGEEFLMLDLGGEYLKIEEDQALSEDEKMEEKLKVREQDAARKERAHNLSQLLRAHLLMEKDVDYIIQESKVVIIDENTGRPQPGRRFADGLHQAIEAKEGVEIQKETQTYATVTLQNYFRMYEKCGGMSGTAITEANEFKEIYKVDVLEIPTNLPCKREDAHDAVYMTEREKYHAILEEVKEVHAKGRPILLGTESVEISEKLSRIFRQANLPHTVLNAKHHESEADIVALAGQEGAITISTNMAGRGTDIKLGEGVAAKGGLHVIGTTRHHSRRIDRQLRGRCSRQGDPGSSKFFISFEDSLMRLFASPRLNSLLKRLRPPEGEAISSPLLTRSIEVAQKRVEQRNYSYRKHTLEYDDVMNKHRKEIYSFRNEVLQTESLEKLCEELLQEVCEQEGQKYLQNLSSEETWNPEGYRQWLMAFFPVHIEEKGFSEGFVDKEALLEDAWGKVQKAFRDKVSQEERKIVHLEQSLEGQEKTLEELQEFCHERVLNALRTVMVRKLDKLWQEHLLHMDHLRSEVSLRSVGQKDPLMEFKEEAFRSFAELNDRLYFEVAKDLFSFVLVPHDPAYFQEVLAQLKMETDRSLVDESTEEVEEEQEQEPTSDPEPASAEDKVGRNNLCPCGSGKKYKKCCGLAKVCAE